MHARVGFESTALSPKIGAPLPILIEIQAIAGVDS